MSQVDVVKTNASAAAAVMPPVADGRTAPAQPAAGKKDSSAEKGISANVDKVSVNDAVKNINSALATLKREERHLNVDQDLGRLVVKIVNSETKEIVRQIPSEEALSLSKRMQEMIGLLFK